MLLWVKSEPIKRKVQHISTQFKLKIMSVFGRKNNEKIWHLTGRKRKLTGQKLSLLVPGVIGMTKQICHILQIRLEAAHWSITGDLMVVGGQRRIEPSAFFDYELSSYSILNHHSYGQNYVWKYLTMYNVNIILLIILSTIIFPTALKLILKINV